MNIEQHIAHRAWAFEALDVLQLFLGDADFSGDMDEEARIIERKRRELKEGKYRVVILGEFNVGKSALVNAFLGDEYLPTVLEECTAKITHIVKSDDMRAVLNLSSPASDGELETLIRLLATCSVTADVSLGEDGNQVVIAFFGNQGRDLVRALRPLVTVTADEDFPQLSSFRGKFDEIYIHLPTDLLADDVALIDSPGVHSISETNSKIAEEVIPSSHLVICLLDSQNPGTEQNREFIEQVVKHRHRKVMFVINKTDQLNPEEIDPKGRRGPAKDLLRSLRGVVEKPEIYFVSALYALVSAQLSRFQLTLDDLDNNNKIKIPWALQRQLMQREDAAAGVAEYLLEKSNIAQLRERLLRYLYTENREGAILESACRFVDDKAWSYARPIQVQLDMARDMPRLAELREQRDGLMSEIADSARRAEAVGNELQEMSGGGTVDGREYPGYEGLLNGQVTEDAVKRCILDPAQKWLYEDVNYKAAKKERFAPFSAKVESLSGVFLCDLCEALNAEVDMAENTAMEKMGALRPSDTPQRERIEASRIHVRELQTSLLGSYFEFAISGGILLALAGAGVVVSEVLEQFLDMDAVKQMSIDAGTFGQLSGMNMVMLASVGTGAAIGALAGIILRAVTGKSVLRKRLTGAINQQVTQFILGSGKSKPEGEAAPVKEQLRTILQERRAGFSDFLRTAFESATQDMRVKLAAVVEEEEELRQKQEEIIARLEPKLASLVELGHKAAETAEANAPREAPTTA